MSSCYSSFKAVFPVRNWKAVPLSKAHFYVWNLMISKDNFLLFSNACFCHFLTNNCVISYENEYCHIISNPKLMLLLQAKYFAVLSQIFPLKLEKIPTDSLNTLQKL